MYRTRTERASIKIPTAQEENEDNKVQSESQIDLDHLSLGKEQLDNKAGDIEEYPDKAGDWDIPAEECRQGMLAKLKV
jgi:hypothetical protein